jgi:hypothetical protein
MGHCSEFSYDLWAIREKFGYALWTTAVNLVAMGHCGGFGYML